MKIVKAAMIGDVVGSPGLEILEVKLPELIKTEGIDFVAVNGENAAEGFGMTESDYRRIVAAGADVVTSGNHVWEKREFWTVLENQKNILRPANYPSAFFNSQYTAAAVNIAATANTATAVNTASAVYTPGTGFFNISKNGINWIVINLQGREFMNAIDCPFQCLDRLLENVDNNLSGVPVILIDFHAESPREKEALAYYADSRSCTAGAQKRVSLFAGTHTHVQTADERILPGGCAYITDLGMTGNTDSVIGMDPKICLERARKQVLYHMEIAQPGSQSDNQSPEGDITNINKTKSANLKHVLIQGVIAEIDIDTSRAVSIKRIVC